LADAFQEGRVGTDVTLKGVFLLMSSNAINDCIVVLDSPWHNVAAWRETWGVCRHGGFQVDDFDFGNKANEIFGFLNLARVGVMIESL
jgi:hypothetical protein